MNISQAKQIPIRFLVEHLGGRFSHQGKPGELWYFSPFRPEEKTASFKVDEHKNNWHDFGHASPGSTTQGSGGDIINLWCDFYGQDRKSISGALSGLEAFSSGRVATRKERPASGSNFGVTGVSSSEVKADRFKFVKEPTKIYLDSLKAELQRRGISLETAAPFLMQAAIQDTKTGKIYYGFCFRNSKNGWEISIPNPTRGANFKTCIGAKAPSYIEAGAGATGYTIFEGWPDFLTWREMNKGRKLVEHAAVLNSTSFTGIVAQHIIDRKDLGLKVVEFLNNDEAGEMARALWYTLMEEAEMQKAFSSNHLYEGYKDLNKWWTDDPNAAASWKKQISPAVQKIYYDPPGKPPKPKL